MISTFMPAFSKNNIPIIFASDNNYSAYLSVALSSLAENSSINNNYDILILEQGISPFYKHRFYKILEPYKNISLRFFDLSPHIKNLNLPTTSNWSVEMYFRLWIPYILTSYDKVIYLDCDLVVLNDIAEFYNNSLENYLIGAIKDLGIPLYYVSNQNKAFSPDYFNNNLREVNPFKYVNSGVLLMNLCLWREKITLPQIISTIFRNNWHYPDQDVLNVLCCNHIKLLHSSWNAMPENRGIRQVNTIKKYLSDEMLVEYIDGISNPKIVHYAMFEKPWLYTITFNPTLMSFFWMYAAKTLFFKDIIKTKLKTCSIGEIEFILSHYGDIKFARYTSQKDLYYYLDDYFIQKISQTVVKYELFEFNNNSIYLSGTISLPPKDYLHSELYIHLNDIPYLCTTFERQECDIYESTIISHTIGFYCELPLNYNQRSFTINLYLQNREFTTQLTRINYGSFFPIDYIIPNAYYYNNGYILKAQTRYTLAITKSEPKERLYSEKKFLQTLWKTNKIGSKKAVVVRSYVLLRSLLSTKDRWIIGDNFLADDNGLAFFKYMCSHDKINLDVRFAIEKSSENAKKIKKIGPVIYLNTWKYKLFLLSSNCSISSVVQTKLMNPFGKFSSFYRDIINQRHFIFLQHGVISQDLSKEHNKFVYNPSGFITSATREYESLLQPKYFYRKKDVWLTGLPRFDYLYNEEKKYITIMPTWRKYLADINLDSNCFTTTAFYQHYYTLLQHPKLLKFSNKYNYQIKFKPHPLLEKFLPQLVLDSNMIFNAPYRQVFAESSLLITDYSSATFDFSYLKKPIIYTQFDKEEFFNGNHVYTKGYFDYENDGFGEVTYDLESTVDMIISYIENDCQLKDKYRDRIDQFFAYSDKNNCKRVYEKILELTKKEQ